jgi:pilus assembly protein Flp/PilA
MQNFLSTLWNDESGQDLAEYALLLALIAIAVVGAIVALRGPIINRFTEAGTVIDTGAPIE